MYDPDTFGPAYASGELGIDCPAGVRGEPGTIPPVNKTGEPGIICPGEVKGELDTNCPEKDNFDAEAVTRGDAGTDWPDDTTLLTGGPCDRTADDLDNKFTPMGWTGC